MANLIRQKIVENIVNKSLYWSLIADETTDIAKIEQFCFVIRYADSQLNLQERFLGFWETPDTKSETLYILISKF